MTTNDTQLILIDGSSYLFRAYHALPPLTNSKGQPTGALYGVINMIKKLLKDHPTDKVAVVFDAKGKTFRHELFSEYKATRPPMPDDLRSQIQPIHDIIKAMGLPLICVEGVEADDVIGTLAMQAGQQQLNTLISTGDKDMAQLVNEHITLINTMNDKVTDVAGVKEKFGVSAKQIIDYLALMGDKVDNIPGVEKVGPKTAAKWINEYGSLDNIIAHADEFKGKIGEHLRNAVAKLPLSQQLATIKTDVDLPFKLENLHKTDPDTTKLIDYYSKYEFKTWLSELLASEQPTQQKCEYTTIADEKTWHNWLQKLSKLKTFAFDTETTSLNTMQAKIVGVSFATEKGEAAYIPLAHDYQEAPPQLDKKTVLNDIEKLLSDNNNTIIGQNLKYDINVLANEGVPVCCAMHDTMLQSYVLNASSNRHDMDTLALKYLGYRTIHYEDIAGKGSKQLTFNQIEIDKASEYAAEDADITLQLHNTLWPKVKEDKNVLSVYESIELPLMPVLAKIERNGVLIDAKKLARQSKELTKRIAELQEKAFDMAGEKFNLGSTKQLQEILFDKLNLPVLSKTPKGAPSTAESVLQDLALDYPLPKVILEFRSLSKLKSTYTDSLPKEINPITGRVHTSYNQAVTATGRLSSTNPNLQNIPTRTEQGRKIRQAFIANKGYKILAADYSQIELRIMAHLSQDTNLLKAFANHLDIHSATAAEVFGIDIDSVTPMQRRSAKAINFGLIYGMSAFGLSRQLGIERKLAQEYMDRYFSKYPGIHNYMEVTRQIAYENGYVETLSGRKLYTPDIHASNLQRRRAAERAAINAPMQGTAADIIKKAMITLHHELAQQKIDALMIMQVHDELVFEVAEQEINKLTNVVEKAMSQAMELSVPLLASIGVGDNWDEAH